MGVYTLAVMCDVHKGAGLHAACIPGWVRRKAATRAGDALRLTRLLTMALADADASDIDSSEGPGLTCTCKGTLSFLSTPALHLPYSTHTGHDQLFCKSVCVCSRWGLHALAHCLRQDATAC